MRGGAALVRIHRTSMAQIATIRITRATRDSTLANRIAEFYPEIRIYSCASSSNAGTPLPRTRKIQRCLHRGERKQQPQQHRIVHREAARTMPQRLPPRGDCKPLFEAPDIA